MTRINDPSLSAIELISLTADHLPAALALSQAAGWPHRVEDWALTLSVSKGVAAFDGGRLVGTAICSDFGPVAALNMVIVAPDRRGQGLGRRLLERVIALAQGREMRLTATEDGLPLYCKLGFAERGHIVQHQGQAQAMRPERPVRFGPADIETLATMDTAASGMERKALLTRIAATGDTLRTDGGFALLRAFGRGHVLGPVVARDPGAARALISAAADRLAGRFLRIDLYNARDLSSHAEALGLAQVGGGTTMVHSPRPPTPSEHHS
jgi:GNAT superfamily N-acetyltransferase